MIQLKTIDELRLMKESARLVSKTLGMLAKEIKPGITTLYLDKLAHDFIKDRAEPAFLGYGGFRTLCVFLRMSR
jgi:methionyl aminopeptidase